MKQLGRIEVHGIIKRVLLALPAEVDNPEDLSDDHWASYQEEQGIIYLHAKYNLEATRAKDSIVHEVCHALIEDTGVENYLKKMTGLDGEAWKECEENIVGFIAPALVSALPSMNKVLASLAKKLGAK